MLHEDIDNMSSIPTEFDPAYIASKASAESQMYRAELSAKDPMKSVLESNPEIYFVPPKRSSEWGQWAFKPGAYYDTTIGAKHAYWNDKDLERIKKYCQKDTLTVAQLLLKYKGEELISENNIEFV